MTTMATDTSGTEHHSDGHNDVLMLAEATFP